jgi:hypothetical protein
VPAYLAGEVRVERTQAFDVDESVHRHVRRVTDARVRACRHGGANLLIFNRFRNHPFFLAAAVAVLLKNICY